MTLWSPQFKTWPVVVSDLYDCWRGGSLQAGEVCVCVCVTSAVRCSRVVEPSPGVKIYLPRQWLA